MDAPIVFLWQGDALALKKVMEGVRAKLEAEARAEPSQHEPA